MILQGKNYARVRPSVERIVIRPGPLQPESSEKLKTGPFRIPLMKLGPNAVRGTGRSGLNFIASFSHFIKAQNHLSNWLTRVSQFFLLRHHHVDFMLERNSSLISAKNLTDFSSHRHYIDLPTMIL